MTELKFHTDTSPFYENGNLIHEPEESLEALMRRYEKACDEYQKGRRRMLEAARPHTVWRWIGNTEPRFIEDSSRNYGHRTWANAAWSDITLALATDFSSPGEITTRKAAGDKYLSYPLPRNLKRLVTYDLDGIREARGIVRMIREHSCFKKEGIRLNIAGNGLVTLLKSGLDTRAVATFITLILSLCDEEGVKILEVRSGGQSGVDEAGIIAAQQRKLKCSILAPKDFRWRDRKGNEKEGRNVFVNRFKEECINFEAWEKADPEGSRSWGLTKFNGRNELEMLKFEIDLRIMHINERASNGFG